MHSSTTKDSIDTLKDNLSDFQFAAFAPHSSGFVRNYDEVAVLDSEPLDRYLRPHQTITTASSSGITSSITLPACAKAFFVTASDDVSVITKTRLYRFITRRLLSNVGKIKKTSKQCQTCRYPHIDISSNSQCHGKLVLRDLLPVDAVEDSPVVSYVSVPIPGRMDRVYISREEHNLIRHAYKYYKFPDLFFEAVRDIRSLQDTLYCSRCYMRDCSCKVEMCPKCQKLTKAPDGMFCTCVVLRTAHPVNVRPSAKFMPSHFVAVKPTDRKFGLDMDGKLRPLFEIPAGRNAFEWVCEYEDCSDAISSYPGFKPPNGAVIHIPRRAYANSSPQEAASMYKKLYRIARKSISEERPCSLVVYRGNKKKIYQYTL